MSEQILLIEVQAALTRCLAVHPPMEPDRTLCPDANRLAEVYGEMICARLEAREIADLNESQRAAFTRWHETTENQ